MAMEHFSERHSSALMSVYHSLLRLALSGQVGARSFEETILEVLRDAQAHSPTTLAEVRRLLWELHDEATSYLARFRVLVERDRSTPRIYHDGTDADPEDVDSLATVRDVHVAVSPEAVDEVLSEQSPRAVLCGLSVSGAGEVSTYNGRPVDGWEFAPVLSTANQPTPLGEFLRCLMTGEIDENNTSDYDSTWAQVVALEGNDASGEKHWYGWGNIASPISAPCVCKGTMIVIGGQLDDAYVWVFRRLYVRADGSQFARYLVATAGARR